MSLRRPRREGGRRSFRAACRRSATYGPDHRRAIARETTGHARRSWRGCAEGFPRWSVVHAARSIAAPRRPPSSMSAALRASPRRPDLWSGNRRAVPQIQKQRPRGASTRGGPGLLLFLQLGDFRAELGLILRLRIEGQRHAVEREGAGCIATLG